MPGTSFWERVGVPVGKISSLSELELNIQSKRLAMNSNGVAEDAICHDMLIVLTEQFPVPSQDTCIESLISHPARTINFNHHFDWGLKEKIVALKALTKPNPFETGNQ